MVPVFPGRVATIASDVGVVKSNEVNHPIHINTTYLSLAGNFLHLSRTNFHCHDAKATSVLGDFAV